MRRVCLKAIDHFRFINGWYHLQKQKINITDSGER